MAPVTTENTAVNRSQWPYSSARSTSNESHSLLCALLTAGTIDEISNVDNGTAVQRYISSQGRVDGEGRTRVGVMFWLYPTGLQGPYHVTDAGQVEQHSTLVTVEQGAVASEAVKKAKTALRTDGVAHVHVASA